MCYQPQKQKAAQTKVQDTRQDLNAYAKRYKYNSPERYNL